MSRVARRSFGAFAFVLMLLRVVAPELGHQCAMETASAVTPVAAATTTSDARGDAAHAGHAQHAAESAHGAHADVSANGSNSHHTPADSPDGGCDCADWCCCLPTVADTPRSAVALATVLVETTSVPGDHHREVPRGAVARLLPFATAPPAA